MPTALLDGLSTNMSIKLSARRVSYSYALGRTYIPMATSFDKCDFIVQVLKSGYYGKKYIVFAM